jgi:hypothetical protein
MPAPQGDVAAQKRAVLDLCDGNRDLARRAWDKFGGDLAAVEAWINTPMDEASDPDGPGVVDGVQLPVDDPQRPVGGSHGVGGSDPSADPHPEEAA